MVLYIATSQAVTTALCIATPPTTPTVIATAIQAAHLSAATMSWRMTPLTIAWPSSQGFTALGTNHISPSTVHSASRSF